MVGALAVLGILIGGFNPVDLGDVLNNNPLSDSDMDIGGVDIPLARYVWLEGEGADSGNGDLAGDPALRASAGLMLGGGFGNNPGDWAEWYFDFPYDTEDGAVYVRTTRAGENAFTSLSVTLNGEDKGTLLVPLNAGWGDADENFVLGLCSLPLGRIHMGRQVLRLTAGDTYEPIALDGLWVATDTLDIVNRIDAGGKIRPPASPYMLVYPFGPRTIAHVPFNLIDPESNGGFGVLRIREGETVSVDVDMEHVSKFHLLGAGVRGAAMVSVSMIGPGGTDTEAEVTLGPLYARQPEGAVLSLGRYRVGYSAPVETGEPTTVASVRLRAESGDVLLLALTAETASDPEP